ncbi:MAG: carbamoyltransferase C-terminal domain-containing protein, partial [Phycisphaerales bacterium]
LKAVTGDVPAITHVDGSARVQTVSAGRAPRFHAILRAFERRTGCPVLVNTSFNIRGEPIVHDPADAYRCFMLTDMDVLVVGNHLMRKERQPPMAGAEEYKRSFRPD